MIIMMILMSIVNENEHELRISMQALLTMLKPCIALPLLLIMVLALTPAVGSLLFSLDLVSEYLFLPSLALSLILKRNKIIGDMWI